MISRIEVKVERIW